jgi:hypothetical protein
MIAVLQFRPPGSAEEFLAAGKEALAVLAERPGFVRGTLGRGLDDESAWAMVTEWESVGAYRRGIGGFDVKLVATPFLAQALDLPTAFEALVSTEAQGVPIVRNSDRANTADQASRSPNL